MFNPYQEITATGQVNIGRSPHGSLSITSSGVTGTLGVFIGDTFFPNADGAISDGETLVFDLGVGRQLGIEVTSGTGFISSAGV